MAFVVCGCDDDDDDEGNRVCYSLYGDAYDGDGDDDDDYFC